MVDFGNGSSYSIGDLRKIIEKLRAPGGCPWDIEQTHESIKNNLLEEAGETVEAIDEGDPEHLCEELGDVLLQIIFHSDIAEKSGDFSFDDVVDMVSRKLIRRHPHVFGDVKVGSVDDVLSNWEAIKREEKLQKLAGELKK